MKKIKLMALGLMVMMIQSVGAVTLPSTSYSPYVGETSGGSESSVVFSSGSMVTGSYSSLGAYEECTKDKTESQCEDCCNNYLQHPCYEICMASGGDAESCAADCGGSTVKACKDACHGGGSLPLDGGLSILLALAIGSGAVRAFKRRK